MENLKIHEVGLRDGLQMESEAIPTITKIQWAQELINSGIDIIQLGSFVNPKVLMQMADTDELFEHFNLPENKPKNTILSALILNEKGLERALKANVDMICLGVSASETHSQKNTRMTVSEATERIIKIAKEALSAEKQVQASVQSAFGCGYEGNIAEEKVFSIIEKYIENGVKIISLADTSGYANPSKVERMFSKITEMSDKVELACHFHNTYGLGMANIYAAYKVGVKYFESAFGGLGGCPFTKVAAGNISTEDMITMFQEMGLRKDINIKKIKSVSLYAEGFLMKELPSYTYKNNGIKH